MRDVNYDRIPNPNMREAIRNWIEHGVSGGDFIDALVSNDLRGTFEKADDINRRLIFEWVSWFYMEAPSPCWGSPEKAQEWTRWHSERRAQEASA